MTKLVKYSWGTIQKLGWPNLSNRSGHIYETPFVAKKWEFRIGLSWWWFWCHHIIDYETSTPTDTGITNQTHPVVVEGQGHKLCKAESFTPYITKISPNQPQLNHGTGIGASQAILFCGKAHSSSLQCHLSLLHGSKFSCRLCSWVECLIF